NGEITGLHPAHKDSVQLAAFIANKTVPPVSVTVEALDDYVCVTVPKMRSITASSSGKIQRRRLKADGTPENVPMYPHEIASRLSDLRMLDYSAQIVPDADYADLDDVERERLRGIIRSYHGEQSLLELDNEELDKALRLATEDGGKLVPTFCGMLLIGKRESLVHCVPTAEAAFQVMNGTSLSVNESFTLPILAAFEKIKNFFDARNSEEEIDEGLFRISVFDYDKRAFCEALVNAFCHRDYTVMGFVRVMLDDDGLTISNPGGFIEGVTLENLLTVEPHGRNTALADALKRIGLAERTGRGSDRIFEGSLLYGKALPDYSESTSVTVKLFIPKSLPDKAFTRLISEEQARNGNPLPLNTLLVLNELKRSRRASIAELSAAIHVSETKVKHTVERLTESGLIEAVGTGRGRHYTLSAKVYQQADDVSGYVRQKGIDSVRYPEMILQYAKSNGGKVTRAETAELLRVSPPQAYRQLKKLEDAGKLLGIGHGKGAYYKIM
ncbi:MAG: winged helix-turn-helix transcriptional regulator, partial [Oscillospiraceae bacterium]|nr:winged helix-turn-helix transcriptional regulator [Oscillospiraceae bacterium]